MVETRFYDEQIWEQTLGESKEARTKGMIKNKKELPIRIVMIETRFHGEQWEYTLEGFKEARTKGMIKNKKELPRWMTA